MLQTRIALVCSCIFNLFLALGVNKMDGVILLALVVPSIICIFSLLVWGTEGTKGITQPYHSVSGKLHTAKRERKDYLV